jgi:hypothetical protein
MYTAHWAATAGTNAIFGGGRAYNNVINTTVSYRSADGTGSIGVDLYATDVALPGGSASAGSNAIYMPPLRLGPALYTLIQYRSSMGIGSTGMSIVEEQFQAPAGAKATDLSV